MHSLGGRSSWGRPDASICVTARSRQSRLAVAFVMLLVIGVVFTASASADSVFKFQETFGSAVQPSFGNATGLAVDQANGDLLVMDKGNPSAEPPIAPSISRFHPDGTPDNFSALGTNVISETPEGPLSFTGPSEAQIAIDNSGTATDGDIYVTLGSPKVVDIFADSGEYLGQLTGGSEPFPEVCGVASDDAGNVYVGDFGITDGILRFDPTGNPVTNADFAFALPLSVASFCTLSAGTGPTADFVFAAPYIGRLYKIDSQTGEVAYQIPGVSTITETTDPASGDVLAARGEEVAQYDASGPEPVEVSRFGLASTVQGVAVGPQGATYVSRAGSPTLEVWKLVPLPTVAAGAATNVTETEVTLNGAVNPEGVALTECKFEYGPTSSNAFESEAPCTPSAGSIPVDSSSHAVSADISGLQPELNYHFRLKVANENGSSTSAPASVETSGKPRITEIRASSALQTSGLLEATVDPRGFDTTYRFEWGPTTAYGNSIPVGADFSVKAGQPPVTPSVPLSGLEPSTVYHYRVVANSAGGTTVTPDQQLETLNACGLPDQRCFELVSPPSIGPVATPGHLIGELEMQHMAAPDGPGAIAYGVESGLPEATAGTEVLYLARRSPTGWSSSQITPPFVGPNESRGERSVAGRNDGLSPDLSCGVVTSFQPLTESAEAGLTIEAGGANLYRRGTDGRYTLITALPPLNLQAATGQVDTEYRLIGMSRDCDRVFFMTHYRYAGVPGVLNVNEGQALYEWAAGTLRGAGFVPGPGGETPAEVVPGSGPGYFNAVSADARRVVFTATRLVGGSGSEDGAPAIFVREDGQTTDVSQSQGAVPDTLPVYQNASEDGSRIFFTGPAGLTAVTNGGGTDLYEYDLTGGALTDLSVDQGTGNANVDDVLGASADGSHVYFDAKGQLLPGRGPTETDNLAAGTLSIYASVGGTLDYVGRISNADTIHADLQALRHLTARVSPEGRFLLFESRAMGPGGEPPQAYLYDAAATAEQTVCLSCRRDSTPSVPRSGFVPLVEPTEVEKLTPPATLTVKDGQAHVLFYSFDQLAPTAVEGERNLYEWEHGQVFLLATQPAGLVPTGNYLATTYLEFAGASLNGEDVYFFAPQALTWEDRDERLSLYDARTGGGFQAPAPTAAPCQATAEGACQGPPIAGPAIQAPVTPGFNGPGNVKPARTKHRKKHHKHHKKKHHKHKSAHKPNKHRKSHGQMSGRGPHTSNDRRAAK